MRKTRQFGLGVGAAVLIASVVYVVRAPDTGFIAATSTAVEGPHPSNLEAPSPVPLSASSNLTPRVNIDGTANRPANAADARLAKSPNRKLLDTPRGDDLSRIAWSMRLNPGERERLLDILADELKHSQEWLAANHRSFISREEAESLRSDSNRLVMDLLGQDKFQRYDDYRRHSVERKPIDTLNIRLVDGGAEMLDQQIDDLLYAAIKEESSRTQPPNASTFGSQTEYLAALKRWREDNMKRFLDRTAALLTPEQFTTLQRIVR